MIRGDFFLIFVVFCVSGVLSQYDCVPKDVQNLILYGNGTLSWTNSPQETCYITHYHINIYREGRETYDLYVENRFVDVSFISFCESWIFTVYALSQDLSSPGHILIARMPMPSETVLNLRSLRVSRVSGVLQLSWELENEQFSSCADRYRVSIDDQDSGELTDVYVTDNVLILDFVSPCVVYEFGVRAIFNNRPSEEGPLISIEYDFPPVKQGAPVLSSFTPGVTTFSTTWSLESRSKNRCPMGSFYVDGGQYFNFTFRLADTPERSPVVIDLHSLEPDSLYLLKVSVENSGGVSDAAIVGVQTLDYDPGAE
ncbi:uncharacterized protein LOC108910404 [Anoplophora glabripennis]|uniref:uncharacterized protein LOC108910404 n=1 Tax=Anoplophora glabripennis TaxID=217634 RepID=UPI000873A47A|nr:uncharacterized protein LOC108910404 [Anoplophora glabripennis]